MNVPNPHHDEVDLEQVSLISLSTRKNKVRVEQFGKLVEPTPEVDAFLDSFPDVLAARRLRDLVQRIVDARCAGRPVILAVGAHVIKCGLAPIINDLMRRGVITGVAMNGAGGIHDYEFSQIGASSEDVAKNIKDGSFGMIEETSQAIQRAARRSCEEEIGFGVALGLEILESDSPFASESVFATAARCHVPITLHVAMGTDIVHMCPGVSGADLGEASHRDFRILAAAVSKLNGGVWINAGSAVVLPEVFLKAVAVARNLGHDLTDVTTCDMDMIRNYRPTVNVLHRPAARGIELTGHHEILFPLLRIAVLSALKKVGFEAAATRT